MRDIGGQHNDISWAAYSGFSIYGELQFAFQNVSHLLVDVLVDGQDCPLFEIYIRQGHPFHVYQACMNTLPEFPGRELSYVQKVFHTTDITTVSQ
jgi:hypothetical protein